MSTTVTRRILALAIDPDDAMSEMDWIVLLTDDGTPLAQAVEAVQRDIDSGVLLVVHEEPI